MRQKTGGQIIFPLVLVPDTPFEKFKVITDPL